MTQSAEPTQRETLARQIAEVFRTNGYEGTSMSQIGEATGLLKGSLYHHFPKGKEDMAKAALQAMEQEAIRLMITPLNGPGTPRERLTAWAKGVNKFYAGGAKECLLGTMMLSGGAGRFQLELKDAFAASIDMLHTVLIEAGVSMQQAAYRAQAAIERIQGALIVAHALDDFSGFNRFTQELPDILLNENGY